MESIGISLGWNCHSASYGVSTGLRSTKANGYKTCPFDEALTNYEGVVACIADDFKHFMELELIDISGDSPYMANETLIYNPRYRFIFNHESPGHGNLWETQSWSGGKEHYIKNEFKLFKERYTRRIQAFRDYLSSGQHINFIICRDVDTSRELELILQDKYPVLKYTIHYTSLQDGRDHYYKHLTLMRC